MYTERPICFFEATDLLKQCGLHPIDCADYRVGIFDYNEELVATGALVGDMLQMIAVSPDCQGEELSVRVVSHLVNYAAAHGRFCLHLFTKTIHAMSFASCGFHIVAQVEGASALLEWGAPGINEYCDNLKKLRAKPGERLGCLVMNCNPFTKGHRYLIEQACAECDRVIILAVEEDLSEFPFSVRLELLRRGTEDLPNVSVIAGGRYAISALTFPAYFSRDAARSRLQSQIDAEIFARHIAPALGVSDRYLGDEPFSESTAIYNEIVQQRLTAAGIRVHIVPRKEENGCAISASEVRRLLSTGAFNDIAPLLPETTLSYILEHKEQVSQWINR